MTANLYQPINGEIVEIIDESPTIKSFVVVPEKEFRFATGQFVELTLPGDGVAPIRSLFLTLVDRIKDFKSVVCRFGARTPEDFIYKKALFGPWQKIDGVNIKLTVDKAGGDWSGNVGVVTTILNREDVHLDNAV